MNKTVLIKNVHVKDIVISIEEGESAKLDLSRYVWAQHRPEGIIGYIEKIFGDIEADIIREDDNNMTLEWPVDMTAVTDFITAKNVMRISKHADFDEEVARQSRKNFHSRDID